MTQQLPGPRAVFLDHVAHFAPEMDAAADALQRCGFRLTPFTAQNRVDGRPVPANTGNRCAMLRQGYVEILTATADTELARHCANVSQTISGYILPPSAAPTRPPSTAVLRKRV